MVKASINIQPVRTGLVRSVDCEHKSRMDLLVPVPTTHLVTGIGHNIMLAFIREQTLSAH